MIPLSVVLIVKNEESRLARALDSVKGWAGEIVVVDDESTDKTREIAARYTDKIFVRKMDVEGTHRKWSYQKASNPWIFSLDADEVLTPELKESITKTVTNSTEHVAFTVPRRNHIGNYWVKWSGQYPARQIKLMLKDKFKWANEEVHPRALPEGTCAHLDGDLLHYTYRDWGDFINKLNGQTTLEARKWHRVYKEKPFKAWWKVFWGHLIWRMVDRFFRLYIGKKGYRDGYVGFVFATFASVYWLFTYAKFWELVKNESSLSRP